MNRWRLSDIAQWVGGTLKGEDLPVDLVSTDTRNIEPGSLMIALRGPHFDAHDYLEQCANASAFMVDRPVNLDRPMIEVTDSLQGLQDFAKYWRGQSHSRLVALTGSNGKTTVKQMLAAILEPCGHTLYTQGNLNNHIGVPLTLLNLRAEHRYAVIEMGANHLGDIALLTDLAGPDVAMITNIGPAHLEGFGSLDGVAKAKGEIFSGLGESGIAVINLDEPYADQWINLNRHRSIVTFGLHKEAQVRGEIFPDGHLEIGVEDEQVDIHLPIMGRHNALNALAASAAAYASGVSLAMIQQGFADFQPPPGRLTPYRQADWLILDDTYNANPASLVAALSTLRTISGPKWVVLGDMAELGDEAEQAHRQAALVLRKSGVERLYAVGPLTSLTVRDFGRNGCHFDDIGSLLERLKQDQGQASGGTLLVKASRSMHFETVVHALCEGGSDAL